jgi:succinate-semialdehyde dehydrogenase / glutarate-semialdehyde dehydrogenase
MRTYPVYLNGDFVCTEETIPVVNPARQEVIAQMSTIGRERVAAALKDAHTAFMTWRTVTAKSRGEFLLRIAAALEHRRGEIARIITLESGKPLSQSLGEVAMSMAHLQWFAEEARRAYGRVVPPMVDGKRHLVIKSPVGVVGAISPWNFPLMLAVRKVAPALAAGCSVVLKPSELTPLTAVAFAECIDAAKPVQDVFQLVMGPADEIAQEFAENPHCRKITFTGSTPVGKKLISYAARTAKPLLLELGGHAPVLVFDDADLYAAVDGVVLAKFRNTGQSCVAANRIYVQRGIYDAFVKTLVSRVIELKMGDGLEQGIEIGPLINRQSVERAAEHVEDAVRGGAKVLCGGNASDRLGNFFEATVLADVPRGSLCMFEETFAPIAPICPFDKEEEAVLLANSSTHGLAAYVFTRDLARTFRLMDALEAGIIAVNDGLPTTSQAPFGGMKQSGWGRELGIEGLDAFLETKHVSIGM